MSYRGQAVYMFAFDIAYEFTREPVTQLLGQKVEHFKVDADKRMPRQPSVFRPLMIRLPPENRLSPEGPLQIEQTIKLLPIGAVTISVTVPFELDHLEKLVDYHDLQLDGRSLYDHVRELAEKLYLELRPYMLRPMEYIVEEEAYTVFCLDSSEVLPAPEMRAEEWLMCHRREVAAILTQEKNSDRLSEQEAVESTSRYLSYYQNDLVVIDWDAALLIDEPDDFSDILYVMELANLHLAELEAYDRLLDRALDRAYRDLHSRAYLKRKETLVQLREIRIDLARYNDQLSNIIKFFGDWHLARVYETLASRFHLEDWGRTVTEKLKTLDDLYQLLQHDQTNRWMIILELAIVLLFIVDLILLFMMGK